VSSQTAVAPPRTLSLVETRCALCGSQESEPEARGGDFEYDTAANQFDFVRCRSCDHVYLSPRPSSGDLGGIYPSNYYAFSGVTNPLVARLRRAWEGGKVKLYRDIVGDGPRRILDVGCGDGRLLELLRDFGSPDWELVGVDFDAGAVEHCRSLGFEAHVSRVEDLPRDGRGFDAITMLQLIEHVDDPVKICERVFDLLEPGGAFIVETPNVAGLDYRLFRGRHWGHYHFPRHWNLFSTPALHRMLRESGFEIVRSEYLISTSAWIVSLHNRFKDRGYPGWLVRQMSYQNPVLLSIFVTLDTVRTRLGLPTSNQRVIARKPRRARDPDPGGLRSWDSPTSSPGPRKQSSEGTGA